MATPAQDEKIAAPHPGILPHTGSVPSSADADMDEADKALRAMGYNPVFKREFTKWSAFSFALSISGIYGTLMTTLTYPLHAGGAASIIWTWLLGGAGGLALAISIAEISSAYPTSGAMYFTLKYLAPEGRVAGMAWIDGE